MVGLTGNLVRLIAGEKRNLDILSAKNKAKMSVIEVI